MVTTVVDKDPGPERDGLPVNAPLAAPTGPADVHAWQWDGTPEQATQIIDWVSGLGGTARYHAKNDTPGSISEIVFDNTQGSMHLSAGETVIRFPNGRFSRVRSLDNTVGHDPELDRSLG